MLLTKYGGRRTEERWKKAQSIKLLGHVERLDGRRIPIGKKEAQV